MPRRLYPHNRVRYWYAYTTDEITTLFNDLGLHKQTIRSWISWFENYRQWQTCIDLWI